MIKVDINKCVGCCICEIICSYHHKGYFDPNFSSIQVIFKNNYDISINLLDTCDCNNRDEDPPCVKMCPVFNCITFN